MIFKHTVILLTAITVLLAVIAVVLFVIILKIHKFKNIVKGTESRKGNNSNVSQDIQDMIEKHKFLFKSFLMRQFMKHLSEPKVLAKILNKIELRLIPSLVLLLSVITIVISLLSTMKSLDNTLGKFVSGIQSLFEGEEEEEEIEEENWSWGSVSDEQWWGDGANGNRSNPYDAKVDVSSYGLKAEYVEIDKPELNRSYNIAFISDLHVLQSDEPEINESWFSKQGYDFEYRRSMFNHPENILSKFVNCLNEQPFDIIIFGGDILDNYSEHNKTKVLEELNKIQGKQVIYIMSDHDYLQDMTTGGSSNTSMSSYGIQGSVKIVNIGKDGDNLTVIAQNNNVNEVTSSDLAAIKGALNSNENTLFFSHVPIGPKGGNADLENSSKALHDGKVYYWSEHSDARYKPGSDQKDLMNSLYNASSLIGSFHGHMHSSWDGELTSGKKMHIFTPGYESSIGVIRINGSNKNSTPGGGTGSGSNEYVITLDDGNYYWFDQSSENCNYNGEWKTITWGRNGSFSNFVSNGCAIYSLAIAISNQLGTPVTPLDVLETVGCTITKQQDGTLRATTSDSYFAANSEGKCPILIRYDPCLNALKNKYGLEWYKVQPTESEIDKALTNGYYVWGMYDNANTAWGTGNTGTHFMVIRKKQNGKYYCFSSCPSKLNKSGSRDQNAVWNMTQNPETPSVNIAGLGGSKYIYAIRKVGGGVGGAGKGSGGGIIQTNKDVYNKLLSSPQYAAKAEALSAIYDIAVQNWGDVNIAYGLMANIAAEGSIGKVEYVGGFNTDGYFNDKGVWVVTRVSGSCIHTKPYTYSYWNKVSCDIHKIAGKTIESNNDKYIIETLQSIPDGVPGIGVGCVQWSGGRRKKLLQKYSALSTINKDTLMMAEAQMIVDELNGGYASVISNCRGKSAIDCGKIICREYESPASGETGANLRGQSAAVIKTLIEN